MTCAAINQFIALCDPELIAKGSVFGEPRLTPRAEGAYELGMTEHIIFALTKVVPSSPTNPYPRDTLEAAHWAKGRFIERQTERWVVEAYNEATKYMVLP